MLAKPTTVSDTGVTPFPTNLDVQTTATNETTNAVDGFADAIPLEPEQIRTPKTRAVAPTQGTQATFVADVSTQTNVSVATPVLNAPSAPSNYEDPTSQDDLLLDESYPTF